MTSPRLPYFDYLLSELDKRNPLIEQSFGRHVHWGYWEHPEKALCDEADFARAAEMLTQQLCALAGIAEGERVLDVGCGFGGTAASLNERFARLQLTGLNIDARQLKRARNLVRPLSENQVHFCQGDACELPFADESFDRILAVECVFHFPSRAAFFQEAYRVLRRGGILALSDFIPSRLSLPLNWLENSGWFEKYNVFGRCRFENSIERYRRLAQQSKLRPVAARDITRQTLPTYRYLERLLARHGVVGGPVVSLIRLQTRMGAIGLPYYYLLSFRKP